MIYIFAFNMSVHISIRASSTAANLYSGIEPVRNWPTIFLSYLFNFLRYFLVFCFFFLLFKDFLYILFICKYLLNYFYLFYLFTNLYSGIEPVRNWRTIFLSYLFNNADNSMFSVFFTVI